MKIDNYFNQYETKLKQEAVLKSIILGLIIGCAFGFIMAFAAWFINFKDFWGLILSGIVLIITTIVATPISYFKIYKPNLITSAKRLDRYGLEERLITMVEFTDNQSYIAKLQRRDAQEALKAVAASDIKFKISKVLITLATVFVIAFSCMSTITGLAEAGIIRTGSDILATILPEPKVTTFEVMYLVGEGGYISGDDLQVVEQGKNAEPVVAIAEDGYIFYCWSDGKDKPTRVEGNIQADVVYEAIFVPLGEGESGDGEGEAGDMPSDKQSQKGDGQGDTQGDNKGHGAGGKNEPANQVIDGSTWVQDAIGSAREDYLNDPSVSQMPDNYINISNNYFELMGPGIEQDNELL